MPGLSLFYNKRVAWSVFRGAEKGRKGVRKSGTFLAGFLLLSGAAARTNRRFQAETTNCPLAPRFTAEGIAALNAPTYRGQLRFAQRGIDVLDPTRFARKRPRGKRRFFVGWTA